jgi:TnpA family transposase
VTQAGNIAMTNASLEREIVAYEGIASQLREQHGSGWVLMVHEQFVKMFTDFSEAARYADSHHRGEQVLIRHTEGVVDSAPFLAVCR